MARIEATVKATIGKTLALLRDAMVDAYREEIQKHIQSAELQEDGRVKVVGTFEGLLEGAHQFVKLVAGVRSSTCTN